MSGDDALSVLALLEARAGTDWAEAVEPLVRQKVVNDLVAVDPNVSGYVFSPLKFAPTPDAMARTWFADDVVESHLNALADGQADDGGWNISWEPPSGAAATEWRPIVTIEALKTLRAYGRLTADG